jgi:hypothetical protein
MRYRKPARFVTKPLAQARHAPKSAPPCLQLPLLDPQVARELGPTLRPQRLMSAVIVRSRGRL